MLLKILTNTEFKALDMIALKHDGKLQAVFLERLRHYRRRRRREVQVESTHKFHDQLTRLYCSLQFNIPNILEKNKSKMLMEPFE